MQEYTETISDDSYTPAIVATLVWLGIGIALDVYLILKRKNKLISDVFRTRMGKTTLVLFCLHIVDRFGKFDPFHLVGGRISVRTVSPETFVFIDGLAEDAPLSR